MSTSMARRRRWRRRRTGRGGSRALALVGCLVATGCGVGPDPDGLPGSVVRQAIPTPLEYRPWWDEISECSGLSGDLDDLRFFVVVSPLLLQGNAFPCGGGLVCNGLWEAPHSITLAPGHLDTEKLVKHEMLHDLLRVKGHPPVFEACDVVWGGTAGVVPG